MPFYNSYTHSMDPKYVLPASRIGAPTSAASAKQLEEFGKALNSGIKNIEVGVLQAEKLETIPREHLQEIRRLSKLTNTNVSLHGPLIDLAGFGEKAWSEHQRQEAEQHMASILDRARELDKEGNIPVVFHSSHHAFSEFYDKRVDEENKKEIIEELEKKARDRKEMGDEVHAKLYEDEAKLYKEGKRNVLQALGIVNQDSGETTIVPFQKKEVMDETGQPRTVRFDPYEKLDTMNSNQWDDERLKLLSFQKQIDEIQERMELKKQQLDALEKTGLRDSEEYRKLYADNMRSIPLMQQHIGSIMHDMGAVELDMYAKFQKWANPELKREFQEDKIVNKNFEGIQNISKELAEKSEEFKDRLKMARTDEQKYRILNEFENERLKARIDVERLRVTNLSRMESPQIWVPTEEFAREKLTETVAGALVTFAKEHPDMDLEKAPVVALENFFPHAPMSRGETLREAVELARKKFTEKLTTDPDTKGRYDRKKAEEISKKLIGATWDMGHINQLRKAGYSEEKLQKHVIEETQKVADVVKHLHITDNFGFTDAHLPPGMGNVPVQEIMKKLEEAKFKGRGVVEAGNYVAEFGINPYHTILEYFQSPMYYDVHEARGRAKPAYWQAESPNFYKDYFIEFPQQHFNLYSSSFTSLPKTFGGQIGTEKSRFSETPNQ